MFYRIRIDKWPFPAAKRRRVTEELFCTIIGFMSNNMNITVWHLKYVICKLPNAHFLQQDVVVSRLLWLQMFYRIWIDKWPLSAAKRRGVTEELFWRFLLLLCRFMSTNMNITALTFRINNLHASNYPFSAERWSE